MRLLRLGPGLAMEDTMAGREANALNWFRA